MRGRIAALLCLLLLGAPAHAQRRETPTVSRGTFQTLQKSQRLLEKDRPEEAVVLLRERLAEGGGSATDRALTEQSLGIALVLADRPEEALEALQAALASEGLTDSAVRQTRLQIGQLQLQTGRTEAGIATVRAWLEESPDPPAATLVLLGNAYTQAGRHAEAVPWVEKGIAAAEDPPPVWLRLAAHLHLVRGEPGRALPYLERLVRAGGRESDWDQLVAAHRSLGQLQRAVAAAQLADALGYRTGGAEQLELAELLLATGRPLEAAQVLEAGLAAGRIEATPANLALQARSLRLAREPQRALAPLEQAARASDDPARWLELGQLHLEAERWDRAEQALRRATRAKDPEERASAQLRLGIALFEQERLDEAAVAFSAASGHAATRRDATRWREAVASRRD